MLTFIKGDTKNLKVTFKDDADVAVNITGATVYFTIKKSENDADVDAISLKTITTHSNASGGETTVSYSSSETNDLPSGNYYYEIRLKQSGGNVSSIEKQKVKIVKSLRQNV